MDEAEKAAAEYDAWFRRQVQIGLDAANAGDVLTHEEKHEEKQAEIATWRAEARLRRAEAELEEETATLTDDEIKAEAKAWCAQMLQRMNAEDKATAGVPADIEDEAARKAAEYDAWFRRKVREALESATFWTDEEMEAEAATWRVKARLRRAAEAQGAANEAGLGRCSEG